MKTETGNPAAIRDALNEAVSVLHVCLDPDFPPTYECLRATIDKCEAALAAPPRNCDKFGTDNAEASLAYEEFCDRAEIEESVNDAIAWLLSLDADKEGGKQ